jgi:hypothetical protein
MRTAGQLAGISERPCQVERFEYLPVRSFLHTLTGSSGAGVAFACGRLSCRQVLRRWGGPDLRVFPTVAEALASLVLEQAEQAEQAES